MKMKNIITGMVIIACAALCAAVWPRSVGDGKVPSAPVKNVVNAEVEASPEETQSISLSDDTYAAVTEAAIENESAGAEGISTEVTETTPALSAKIGVSTKPSSDPKAGTVSIINGEQYSWFPGFGWVKDEGGGSITIPVDGDGDINKQVGIMGGDSTSPANNEPAAGTQKYIDGKLHVWMPGFGWIEYSDEPNVGTVAEDMYENGNKIGSMGCDKPQDSDASSSPTEQPESTGDEIQIVFVETSEKNSTPPPYKHDITCP